MKNRKNCNNETTHKTGDVLKVHEGERNFNRKSQRIVCAISVRVELT